MAAYQELKMSRWQTTVSEDVLRERLYQDRQWGHEVDDTRNTPWMWTAYICSYATKWMKDPFNFTREDTMNFTTNDLDGGHRYGRC